MPAILVVLAACNALTGLGQDYVVVDCVGDSCADASVDQVTPPPDVRADVAKVDAVADVAADRHAPCDGKCEAGQACVNEQCVCDTTSCTGCCEGVSCRTTTRGATACGAAGASCAACDTARSDTCDATGVCVCGASGVACATGQQCIAGRCACNAASCPTGCCDATGKCQAETTQTCGKGGAACAACAGPTADRCDTAAGSCACGTSGACSPGQTCSGSACTCGGGSCTGCCGSGNTCDGTPAFPTCGKNGAQCKACNAALADRCDANGNCACGAGAQCNAGQRCLGGACVCDATSCTAGCCNGTTCTAQSLGQCGPTGQACAACDTTRADQCLNGACSCGANGLCAAGQQCVGGGCVCNATSCSSGCCSGTACTTRSASACGPTGGACVNCQSQVQNATGVSCNGAGGCDYTSCLSGYADVDGNRSNGCESTLPTGVPEFANLVLWLNGDDWNGNTWPDRSPGGRTAALYFGSVGIGSRNGHAVASFGSGELRVTAGFPSWTNGLTVLSAINSTNEDGEFLSMGVSYNPSCNASAPAGAPGCVPYDMLGFNGNMSLQQCDPGAGTCYQVYGFPSANGSWFRMIGQHTPGATPTYRIYQNGNDEGAIGHNLNYPYPAPWSTPRTDTILGWGTSGKLFTGQVGEIIIFNTSISAASRQALDAYLSRKWGI